MNIIEKVTIDGLWGNENNSISFPLDKNFNFLIGQNGTGKTTVINLISAALEADFERLDRINFSRVIVALKTVGSRKKPQIEIVKSAKKDIPYFDIEYRIKNSASEKPISFDLDLFAEEKFYRGLPPRILRERFHKERYLDVQRQIQSLVKVSWLSVHRHKDEERGLDDRKFVSSVDSKLQVMHNELVRYFALLGRRYYEQTQDFQKKSFISMLTSEKEADLLKLPDEFDIEAERSSLSNLFELLKVKPAQYERQLRTHVQKFEDARKSLKADKALTLMQFGAIFNTWKMHSLVQLYEDLEAERKKIFKPREMFLEVINRLLGGRKTISLTDRNELLFRAQDGRQILIEDLSSGEKQLLIILGEALLQQSDHVVYIADEPELSLHVTWQEQLTSAISLLNPNAQIIFATHSPDIVGSHADKVISMESLL